MSIMAPSSASLMTTALSLLPIALSWRAPPVSPGSVSSEHSSRVTSCSVSQRRAAGRCALFAMEKPAQDQRTWGIRSARIAGGHCHVVEHCAHGTFPL